MHERWGGRDRREFPRAGLTGDALFRCAGREYILTSRDVSECGMGAQAEPGISGGSEGSLALHITSANLPLVCRCRVIYSAEGKGLGIEFLDLSEESRMALKNFVDEVN